MGVAYFVLGELDRQKHPIRLRTLAKPACFLVLLFLLIILSKVSVTYVVVPAGAPALPPSDREKVLIKSLNGNTMTIAQDTTTEDEAQPVSYDTWNESSNQLLIQPEMSQALGCATLFTTTIVLNITTDNILDAAVRGTINVSVIDDTSKALILSRLVIMDFKPYTPLSAATTLTVNTDANNPRFLITVDFPPEEDLASVPATVVHVPLYKYLLIEAGLVSPSLFL